MTNDPFGLLNLEDDLDAVPTKAPSKFARKKFECTSCRGSGLWQGGRTNRNGSSKCHACNGLGYFVTSPEQRQKARARYADKKTQARLGNQAKEQLFKWLSDNSDWNNFAASLMDQHRAGKSWSDKQIAAATRMMEKTLATQAARKEARKAAETEVDLKPIRDMFETAAINGHKRPIYRAEGLVINRAPMHGRNPGALYVKDEAGEYMGKVIGTTFQPARNCMDAGIALVAIATNPLEAAVRYGRRTGTCACCGRELTNAESIERGIGPICAEKWGLV